MKTHQTAVFISKVMVNDGAGNTALVTQAAAECVDCGTLAIYQSSNHDAIDAAYRAAYTHSFSEVHKN